MPIGDKKGGFIRPGYDPLEVPNEPTSVSVTAGDTELEVSFTAPANTGGGAITAYQAATTTGASTTGASSPLTITGLTNDVTYNVRVWALNAYGPGPFGTGSGTPETLQRGIFAGGYNGPVNTIQYVNIASTGNSTDFGDLLGATATHGGIA
jgi:large repetitive protein